MSVVADCSAGGAFRVASEVDALRALLLSLPPERGMDAAADGNAALRLACEKGYADVVQALLDLPLKCGVDPSASGNAALRLACQHGHEAVVQLLLALPRERGVDLGDGKRAALYIACKYGQLAVVRVLLSLPLQHFDVNFAFFVACERGHVDVATFLLTHQAKASIDPSDTHSVHKYDSDSDSESEFAEVGDALAAACKNGHVEMVRMLVGLPLSAGVRPAVHRNAALRLACQNGHAAVVQVLLDLPLERGVDPVDTYDEDSDFDNDSEPDEECDALIAACEHGHVDVVKLLLALPPERGINPADNEHGAFQAACCRGHVEVAKLLLPQTPGFNFGHCFNLVRFFKQWSAMAWLIEQDLDLSHEDWLGLQLGCVAAGQLALLARVSYLQRRAAFLAHQFTWR